MDPLASLTKFYGASGSDRDLNVWLHLGLGIQPREKFKIIQEKGKKMYSL